MDPKPVRSERKRAVPRRAIDVLRFWAKLAVMVVLALLLGVLLPSACHERAEYRAAERAYEEATMAYARAASEGKAVDPEIVAAKEQAERRYIAAIRRYRYYFAWLLRDPSLIAHQDDH
jgi:outer membrane murein-binding lipoprotein Lpp